MTRRWFTIIGGLWLTSHTAAQGNSQQSNAAADTYLGKAAKALIWESQTEGRSTRTSEVAEQYRIAYEDRLLPAELRYLAASAYSYDLYLNVNYEKLRVICQMDPPREDDYVYQSRCLFVSPMQAEDRIKSMYDLGENAYKASPSLTDSSYIYSMLANHLILINRYSEGIRAYKRAYELIPGDAADAIAEAKLNLAFAYTNPMFTRDMKKQGITYYEEALAWYKNQKGSYYQDQTQITYYNVGIAHLFLFEDYASAIENLQKVLTHPILDTDARVFLAFSYARSGQAAAARDLLKTFDLTKMKGSDRLGFLACYRDLTHHFLGRAVRLNECWQLKDPQSDVLLHLTQTFHSMQLPAPDENLWWRMFYRTFNKNMLPDIQASIASASSEAELVKERAESRLKDMKLQNLALYQALLVALTTLTLLFGVTGFLTWKARSSSQKERKRLQNILDSIEEGILLIRTDLSVQAEESQHLKTILGVHYQPRFPLSDFLSLTALDADAVSTQIACLKAAMDEDPLAWELNQGNLVTEVQLGERGLALSWHPVYQQNRLRSIFLALRDITDLQRLKAANVQAQDDADKVLTYVKQITKGHAAAVLKFLHDLPGTMEGLERDVSNGEYAEAMRRAHTVKGSARSLGLGDLREVVHQLEDHLQARDDKGVRDFLQRMQAVARLYQAAQQFVAVDQKPTGLDLFQIVAELRPGLEQTLRDGGLEGGEIQVREIGHLTPTEYEGVRTILLHALTNAADHGFILPTRKGRKVRNPILTVELRSDDQQRSLGIRDNGVGLAHDTLRALADARGWRPQEDENWSDILFSDGITTAESVTASSGRGVGLAAVKQAAQSLGGRVRLLDNDLAPGTMLTITWDTPNLTETPDRLKPALSA